MFFSLCALGLTLCITSRCTMLTAPHLCPGCCQRVLIVVVSVLWLLLLRCCCGIPAVGGLQNTLIVVCGIDVLLSAVHTADALPKLLVLRPLLFVFHEALAFRFSLRWQLAPKDEPIHKSEQKYRHVIHHAFDVISQPSVHFPGIHNLFFTFFAFFFFFFFAHRGSLRTLF